MKVLRWGWGGGAKVPLENNFELKFTQVQLVIKHLELVVKHLVLLIVSLFEMWLRCGTLFCIKTMKRATLQACRLKNSFRFWQTELI